MAAHGVRRRSSSWVAAAAALATAAGGFVIVADATAASAGCQVGYQVGSQWSGGFTANVTITNLGDAMTGWKLVWSFTAGQTITQGWNATISQAGSQVTAADAGYNASLGSGASTSFGFNASWNNASNPVPGGFALNGVACTGSVSGSSAATTSPTRQSTSPPTSPPTSPSTTTRPPTTPASTSANTITVAADGSGSYTTVQAAVNAVPANNTRAYTISIKPGTYRGTVSIPSNKPYISLVGAGSSAGSVVIVESHASGATKPDGSTYGTSGSATVTIAAADTTVSNLTMSNDFNEAASSLSAKQAVAVNTSGDRVQFDGVRILGNQDTLLVNTSGTAVRRLYVRNSYVEGDVDFIFGGGTAVFQNGEVRSLTRGSSSNNGYVTAAATNINNKYGFLFWGTHLTSNAPAKTVYLGRPWHPSGDVNAIAQVLYRGCTMDAHIRDDPWTDMSGFSWKDARFFEYGNTGTGAVVNANRPQMSASTAASYTPTAYLAGSDGWNPIH